LSRNLDVLSEKLGYRFKNRDLLGNALVHSSYAHEHNMSYSANNERLEFLGDAFFDAVIAEKLYFLEREQEEGTLSKLRASVVCEESLIRKADEIGLAGYVLLGNGEKTNAVALGHKAFEADALEAVFGAVFLDGGYPAVRDVILRLFSDVIDDALHGRLSNDYKSRLQEVLNAGGQAHLEYAVIGESGPDHDKTFEAEVRNNGEILGRGNGKTKKQAEQHAARMALRSMEADENGEPVAAEVENEQKDS
jgi:ribonuclease-3